MGVVIRQLEPRDREDVHEALARCGAFTEEEIRVALEIFDEGPAGGYTLLGAEDGGRVRGYVCLAKASLTQSSWYLYWICVHPEAQGVGLGRVLEERAAQFVASQGGRRLALETSGRADYARVRRFYENAGYVAAGRIPDFYKPGDDCVIYYKLLGPGL